MRGEKMNLRLFGKIFGLGLAFLGILGFSTFAFGASLNLGEGTGGPSADVTIAVTLVTGGTQISAVATDISYNTSLLENPRAAIGPSGTAAGKQIISSTPSPGVFRIGVLSITNNNPIGDGVVANVTFKIKSGNCQGDIPLINTPSASDPSGNPVSISGTNGVIHCQTQAPAQLNLSSACGSPGGSVKLPITLVTSGWNISGTSNDLQYNSLLLKSPTCEIGPSGSAAGKGVQCNVVGTGLFRVGVVGLNTNSIGDGIVAFVTFGIDPSAQLGSEIPIDNTPSATDSQGGLVPMTGTDGEVCVIELEITPSAFPSIFEGVNGFAGVLSQWQLQVSGGASPYTWSIVGGSLPEGLTLDPSTGLISGRPLEFGLFPFTVKVIDHNSSEATKNLSLKIVLLGDSDGNGTVAINELQIVINSYLGIYPPKD